MRFTTSVIATAVAVGVSAQEFTFTGANEAGAEFGENNLPGELGVDYTWPVADSFNVCHPWIPRLCVRC